MAKLRPLSGPQKKNIDALAHHHVMLGLAAHLKTQGLEDTASLVSNYEDAMTPKECQILRAYSKRALEIRKTLAEKFKEEL